ncbi:MAG TPA: hypothetical protein VFI95_25450 [Terriglobales bacterium]|nr:hypothetical protein [Terriglobales bacterium]
MDRLDHRDFLLRVPSKIRRRSHSQREQGFILITLMFLAAIVVIALAAALPQMSQQMKRDQEQELIHRGVQYARAIQHFYKKTGRYPVRLEELDNFNNVRFLRKHYKDPITGKDFKILHFGEVRTNFGPGIAGALNPVGNVPGAAPGAANVAVNPGPQANASQAVVQNPSEQDTQAAAAAGESSPANQQPGATTPNPTGTDTTSAATAVAGGPSTNPATQVFGGGPIVGVASASKKKSIREFNKKNHYNDWQFIYDPSSDRGGLLNTPAQPQLQTVAPAQGNVPGVPALGPGITPQPSPGMTPPGMSMPNQPPDQTQPPQ